MIQQITEFHRQEGTAAKIEWAKKEIADFPKWHREHIQPDLDALGKVKWLDGEVPQCVEAWANELSAPIRGGSMAGVFVPPIVDQLKDAIAFVNNLKTEDLQNLNMYRAAQGGIAQRFSLGDVRGRLLMVRGQLREFLARYLEAANTTPAAAIVKTEHAPQSSTLTVNTKFDGRARWQL